MTAITLGSRWLDLQAGVRIHAAPISTPLAKAARRAAAGARALAVEQNPDVDDIALNDIGYDAFVKIIAAGVIEDGKVIVPGALLAWEGVGDAAGDQVDATPENIVLLLSQDAPFQNFDRLVTLPYLQATAEKNASSASSDGSTAKAAQTTAEAA